MKNACMRNKGLDVDVQKWVIKEVAVPWDAGEEH